MNPTPPKRASRLLVACCIIWALGATGAQALDKLYLRDGTSRAGKIVNENNGTYVFTDRSRGTTPIAKEKVRFAVYGDPERASEMLGLKDLRKYITAPTPSDIQILPTEEFSREVIEAVRGATKSVQLMTYYLSGGDSFGSREFFSLLKEKAKAKKKITIIAPFGSRAHAAAKISSMNYGQQLADLGMTVKYLQKTKVQHKKLIIVDGTTVFIGSSNLTSSGLSKNAEINLKVTDPAFVAEAKKDFSSMQRMAKYRSSLKL